MNRITFKNELRHSLPIIALVVLVLAFLWKGVLAKGIFFGSDEVASDLVHFSYPYREYWATDYLKKFQIPLWNSYLSSGVPILAEAQTGILYPPSMLLYYFLSPMLAFNWLIIFSFLLVALGVYFFARQLKLSPLYAFFSAAIFTLSGFMIGHLRHVPMISAMAVMPWMFWATEKILTQGRLIWAVILVFLVATSFFAGHLTTTYLILLILGVYFLLRLPPIFATRKTESILPIIIFLIGMVAGIALAAIQLLPTLELIRYSTRASADIRSTLGNVFQWRFSLMFLSPYILGDPSRGTWDMDKANFWENVGYIGILPLLLAFVGFIWGLKRSNQYYGALKITLILVLVLTLGINTPIYKLFWDWVPGFSFTRIPGRFLLFVDFFLAILAGFGLKYLGQKITRQKRLLIEGLIIIISLADLIYFGYPFNTVIPFSYLEPPGSVKYLKQDQGLFRVRTADRNTWREAWEKSAGWRGDLSAYLAQRELLPPDYNLLFRLPSTSLIYALTGHYSVKKPEELDSMVLTGIVVEEKGDPQPAKLMGLENIKYILNPTELPIDFTGFELVATIPTARKDFTAYIYKNKYWLPRAYFVGKAISIPNDEEIIKKLTEGEFDPAKEVIIDNDKEYPQTQGRGEVLIESYADTEVKLKADLKDSGFVVLSDTFYPGWQAYVDGQKTEILPANYAYRALYLDQGIHSVVFRYKPLSFKIGAIISLAGIVISLILLWYHFWPVRKRGAPAK